MLHYGENNHDPLPEWKSASNKNVLRTKKFLEQNQYSEQFEFRSDYSVLEQRVVVNI